MKTHQNKAIFFSTIKHLIIPFIIMTIIYLSILLFSISVINSNTVIFFSIEPYDYGSGPIDLFFPLISSIIFSWNLYFLRKDSFLTNVQTRINKRKYITIQIFTALLLTFIMVFIVNFLGVIFSISTANILPLKDATPPMEGMILDNYQMNSPLLFGLIWSVYKGFIGMLICLLGQIWGLYSNNLFLILLAPFVTVFIENLVTGLIRIEKYSFTTSLRLNRLQPEAMSVRNIVIGIISFSIIILVTKYILRSIYESTHSL